eukprot:5674294-Ditylum_brightwellii.AAC.1
MTLEMKELAKGNKGLENQVKNANLTKTINDQKLQKLKESIEFEKTRSTSRDNKYKDKKNELKHKIMNINQTIINSVLKTHLLEKEICQNFKKRIAGLRSQKGIMRDRLKV